MTALTLLFTAAILTASPTEWRHIMNVGDAKVVAVLDAPPKMLLRTDGIIVPGFTVEDGLRITEALRNAGASDRVIAQHLLGVTAPSNIANERADQESAAAGRQCPVTFTVPDGIRIRVPLKGGYVPYVIDPETMQRVRRFSVDDALRIKAMLNAEGFGDVEVMNIWLGLLDTTPISDTEAVGGYYRDFAIGHDDPLRPGCGECIAGRHCSGDCCAGAPHQCESCKVCP